MVIQELFATLGLKLNPNEWERGEKFLDAVKTGFIAVASAFGLSKVRDMILEVGALGAHAKDTAASLGVTTQAVTELGYAAELGGSNAALLEMSLKKLSLNLAEVASKGEGPAADALRSLGIRMKDLRGETLDQNLELIASKFAAMPDGAKKARLAVALFGKSGQDLIPFLNNGQEGIVALRREAESLGLSLSGEAAEGLAKLEDASKKLGFTWQGLKAQVVSALVPALLDMAHSLSAWISENREVIAQGLHVVIKAAEVAFKMLGVVVGSVVDIVSWFREGSDAAKAVLIGLAYVITAAVVPALWAMVSGWIAAAAPVLATTAVVAGIALVIMDLWKSIKTGKGVFADVWRYITTKLGNLWTSFKNLRSRIRGVFRDIGDSIREAIVDAFNFVIRKTKELASEIWADIKDIPVIGRIIQTVEDSATGRGIRRVAQTVEDSATGRGRPGFIAETFDNVQRPNAPVSQSATVTNQITINPPPGMSPDDVARKVAEYDQTARREAFDAVRGGVR